MTDSSRHGDGRAAPRTALIVGAGIGGLAAGLALRRAGWQVQIHERAPNPRELGFALGLAPNAMAALRELGLADAMIAEGVRPTKAEVRQTDGRLIRAFAAPPGASMVIALRQALHGALMQAVGRDATDARQRSCRLRRDGRRGLARAGGWPDGDR